jgi:hypothetical protein
MADKPENTPETIHFDYLKSSQFRVVHADGAFIALSQTGVNVSFFAERQPIPRRAVHRIEKGGVVGEEIVEQRVVRDAIIRDTEVSIMLSVEAAQRVVDALNEILKRYKEITAEKQKSR